MCEPVHFGREQAIALGAYCQDLPHLLNQRLPLLTVKVVCSRGGVACGLLALLKLKQAALHSLMLCLHTHIPSDLPC